MESPTLSEISSREELVKFFDGYSAERAEDLAARKLRRGLVKSQLIEVLDGHRGSDDRELEDMLARRGLNLERREEGLFLVRDAEGRERGFLERLGPRILSLYSIEDAKVLLPWVSRIIKNSPELDHVWLSGQILRVLWDVMVKLTKPHRFTRLVFSYQPLYDYEYRSMEVGEGDEPVAVEDEKNDEIREQRGTRLAVVDRVGIINGLLCALQRVYPPFHAICQLRFPSPVGRGGHDFYDNGRVTNRSESFRDHRAHLLFIVRIYEKLLKVTEEVAWYCIQESPDTPGQFHRMAGAPIVIRFHGAGLTKEVFDGWIGSTFRPAGNQFRLWGNPIWLGPTKVHVYGVDRHLWRPLFLEITAKGCVAIVPKETCGNTVHRLVTNVQRYVDPACAVFIGDRRYEDIVRESASEVSYAVRA